MNFLIRKFLLLCCALSVFSLSAQSNYSAELDNYHVEVGDSIVLRVATTNIYDHVEKVKLEVLQAVPQIEASSDRGLRQFSTGNSIVFESIWIAFDTGDVTLPPIPVVIAANGTTYTAYTNALQLKITEATLDSTDTALAPLKEIEIVEIYWYDYWPLYLNILLGVLLLYILFRYFRKRKTVEASQEPSVPEIPALESALHRLDELEKSNLISEDLIVLFYTELSHIYRAYLGKQFGMVALESSTTEILDNLDSLGFPPEIRATAGSLMNWFDLAKFGQDHLSSEINSSAIVKTRDHILELDAFYIKNNVADEVAPVS
jgi:hypothetical protein